MLRALRKAVFGGSLRAMLSRRKRQKLGRRILDEALGENNCDPARNGEYHVMGRAKDFLKEKSAVVFDVGANVGTWTLAFAKDMPEGLTVYSFEPCSESYKALSGKLALLTDGPSVVPVNVALGDRNGSVDLHIAERDSGTNSLILRNAESMGVHYVSSEKVSVMEGDAFCARRGVHHIDFLKVDTEGNEIAVIKGFESMIAEGRIGCIQFEYGGTWIDARALLMDAFRSLTPRGYAIGKLFPRGVQLLDQYDQRLETFQYANYIAMKPDWVGLFGEIK